MPHSHEERVLLFANLLMIMALRRSTSRVSIPTPTRWMRYQNIITNLLLSTSNGSTEQTLLQMSLTYTTLAYNVILDLLMNFLIVMLPHQAQEITHALDQLSFEIFIHLIGEIAFTNNTHITEPMFNFITHWYNEMEFDSNYDTIFQTDHG